ncbi:2OG-Fe(II) oxygenase family protein [Sphingobium sufflavum]|uniref:putative 2OG-Fe(II) oxygenase n=1 Tax=Sphingobium sufflavum TaxID=1129547 RepID=UPI001F18C5D3|nr:putative 2OG-Fe(II) oxygenase [Sphingobium sufflavum]MCE7795949.1 2OG-Fe(II) oxygenase family protein [Sphingobium sufflavum]
MTAQRPHRSDYTPSPALPRGQGVDGAIALYAAGDIEGALAIVVAMVDADPDWTEGYRTAGELLWQCGTPDAFADWLSHAVRRNMGKADVAVTCLRMLSDAGFHSVVEDVLPVVRSWAGDHLFFTMLAAVAASERGDIERADALFARAGEQGGTLALPHVSHLIKYGRAGQAADLAEQYVEAHPNNQTGWGLLGTAWRIMGHPRHEWLVDRPGLVRCIDMDVEPEALTALAARLRTLHVARTHPFDMSLRGGTQTAGKILERQEPELTSLRLGFFSALYRYVAGLPPEDMRHPLLGRRRGTVTLSDSWSVRLLDGGYHVSHIHPVGSLSAAFYAVLPPPCESNPHAGWLTIGAPPVDLNTGLPPLRMIEPKLGRLVLFPSYMWHGTLPFPQGERITVAFDTLLSPDD